MKEFDFSYGDEKVSKREILILLPSMLLAVGVLTLPRTLINTVHFIDAWLSILIAGALAALFAWVNIKLASLFPGKSFYEYCGQLIPKPLAFFLTFCFAIHFMLFSSFEARSIATISKQYIFDRTPVEVISLVFVLIIGYAAFGSRAAIFRLNMMFFPIAIFVLIIVLVFNVPYMEWGNVKPFFEAQWSDIFKGTYEAAFAFLGFEILLFYISMVEKKDLPKVAKTSIFGMIFITMLYIIVLFICVMVFSLETVQEIMYPTVELTKEVEVPGGIIERIDPLFFTVWTMTIFNTASMTLDITVMALQSLFKKVKKSSILFILLPIIYLVSMLPQDHIQLLQLGKIVGDTGLFLGVLIPSILLIIATIRRGKE